MSLRIYQTKRHFNRTTEPKGKTLKKHEPIFVVQKHAASHLHYDFRLAIEGVLKSWAIPKGPCLDPSIKRLAVEVEDHPLEYAKFEGTIPAGEYGAGQVIVWDYGHWQTEEDLAEAYKKGSMQFTLHGHKLLGVWRLIRLKQKRGTKPQWLLLKSKDKYTKQLADYDITVTEADSVLSGKSLSINEKLKQSKPKKKPRAVNLPQTFKPELATLSKLLPPDDDNWLYETKYDGYRILAFIENEKVQLISRNHQDWTHKFPTIASELTKLKLKNTLLDGELVVLDKNKKSHFQLLQNSIGQQNKQHNIHYFIFDMPFYQEKNITTLPLITRKEKLLKHIFKTKVPHVHYSEHVTGDPEVILKAACEQGLEGIMAKLKSSAYQQQRTENWLKLKCHQRQEFIIIGFTQPKGSRQYFGSLLLAYYDDQQQLIYCGHVGTGFNRQSLKFLYEKLLPLQQSKMPLAKNPRDPLLRKVNWVKPKLVAEVEFTEWTQDKILRHPVYLGLREDKPAQQVTQELPLEKPSVSKEITHANKILYPAVKISKADLANYYNNVAEKILPYIQDRPLTILRCPMNNQKKCFMQKHWTLGLPEGLLPINIAMTDEKTDYVSLHEKVGLVGLAQLDVLEIHPWASNNINLEAPTQLIFDLDPDVKIKWSKLVTAANLVRETLQNLGLKSFIKLTGGKGVHVVVPLAAKQSYEQIKAFAKLVAEKLAQHFPKLFTANVSMKQRTGKIFIDYLRNAREATAIAPFSPRHDDNASIAVPIAWEDLPKCKSSKAYNINSIEQYFNDYPTEPWKEFFTTKQVIKASQIKALNNLI